MILLLVMVKNIPIFNILIPIFLQFVLNTLDEVSYVEIIQVKLIIEVIILRQEHVGKCWFIRSCPFLKLVAGIEIASTAELYDRVVIIQEGNNNNAGSKFQAY